MPSASVTPATGNVQVASVTLTSAQVLAIFTTPVQIVAAPGAGLMIDVIHASFNYTYGGTAYADGGGALQVFPVGHGSGSTWASVTTNGFWTSTVSRIVTATTSVSASNLSVFTNLALQVGQSVANPTLGNGTVTVMVAYMTLPVS